MASILPSALRKDRLSIGRHNLSRSRAKQCGLKDDAIGVNPALYGGGFVEGVVVTIGVAKRERSL